MSFKNNKFWFWGFILLLILNISAISSMGYFMYQVHKGEGFRYPMQYHKNFPKHNKRSKTGRWDEMNFTKSQRQFIRKQRREHHRNMMEIKEKQNKTHDFLFKEISKQNPDTELITKYKKTLIQSHKNMIDESIRFYQQLKTELNQEQIQMINNHISRRFHKRHKSRR